MEKNIAELKKLCSESLFQRTRNLLLAEVAKIEAEVAILNEQLPSASNGENDTQQVKPVKQRIKVDLNEHAFDESDKFVKIYVPFNDCVLTDDDVEVDFTANSFSMLIHAKNGKDYRFVVNNLLREIDVSKSYRKTKPNMVSLFLKKGKEGTKWECLTVTEKRLKDHKSHMFKKSEEDKDDPMGGLMKIMQQMYETGDTEMKRTIAKAWQEGQEKRNTS